MKLSVLSAVFNEEKILDTVSGWISYLEKCKQIDEFEIILCDDHSQPEYYENLAGSFTEIPNVHLIRNPRNEGPGYSFSRCIQSASMEYSLITDSDGQFPIENVEYILQAYQEKDQTDLIVFTHREKKYDNLINVFGQKISNRLCNWIHNTNLQDFTCAFKFVPTSLLKKITLDAKYMNYSLDHTSKLLETEIEYLDIAIHCVSGSPKKRGLLKEFKRAFDRFFYIYYLWYRNYLLKKRILFHRHND